VKGKVLSVLVITALLFVAVFPFVDPAPVWADQVTFYPTEDSRLEEDEPTAEHGYEMWLAVNDHYDLYDEHRERTVIRLANQADAGNFTEVLLKLYYGDYYDNDPSGFSVRAYRLTDSFEEYEVTWTNSEDGDPWTAGGGDYSTANYAQTSMPSAFGWVTFNVTVMAQYAWQTLDQDLYVLVRYRYENKDADSNHWAWLCSAEYGDTALRPQYIVTYTAAEQLPVVAHTVDEYGDDYIDLEISPTLYDYEWGVLYAQGSINATGNYTLESAGLNVTLDDPVIRSLTGLNYSSLYGVRAKLVYGNGTVYSNATNVTTMSYVVPTWAIDYDDLMIHQAQVYAGWTANNDTKTVYAKIAYRDEDTPSWTYTTTSSSSLVANEFNWILSGIVGEKLHYYKGVYTIDGYTYETDVANFTTLSPPGLVLSVNSTDVGQIVLRADYYCNGADEISLYSRVRVFDEWGGYIYSDERDGLTGNGTEYFTFNDLIMQTKYACELIAEYEDGYTESDGTTAWTVSLGVYPTLSDLSAVFILPNTIRLSMAVVLNDVEGMDAVIRFWLKCSPEVEGDEYFSTEDLSVYDDGVHYIDVAVGDFLDWEWEYLYYGQIDYVFGTNETAVRTLATPPFEEYVSTLNVEVLTATTARLSGWLQMEFSSQGALAQFQYWETGTFPAGAKLTGYEEVQSGQFSVIVTNLVYGRNYTCRAMANINQVYGNEITWVQGTGVPVTVPGLGSLWTFLTSTTGGHWLIILLAMGFTALIFFRKHRTVAVVLCLMIFGLGIVIGWVDPWVIVLLAIGGGLWIWQKVSGARKSAD